MGAMDSPILGLHHVTATVNDAQADLDFCLETLGLRLVKKTVNFDNHLVYHFYYGNERGTPGTIWTTFPYRGHGVPVGTKGAGQVTVTARGSGDALAIDVSDEGRAPGDRSLVPGPDVEEPPPEGGHRLGLRMASSLALGTGGRLVHAHTEARTRMTLLLPPPEG